ncbi:MAG: hypothetical protein JKX67_07280, partial [Colwellia sp.]|nr:hypothetical protein [Colwellia sp.]
NHGGPKCQDTEFWNDDKEQPSVDKEVTSQVEVTVNNAPDNGVRTAVNLFLSTLDEDTLSHFVFLFQTNDDPFVRRELDAIKESYAKFLRANKAA